MAYYSHKYKELLLFKKAPESSKTSGGYFQFLGVFHIIRTISDINILYIVVCIR